ncbi:MAG TPA: MMPL family transporter [Thermoleophilaceae bacterium]|nr:MMPL family transporter [Thermoleophilaceae bacterium]
MCAARPRRALAAWVVLAIAGVVLLPALQERLDEGGFLVDGSESARVERTLERQFPAAGASLQLTLPSGPGTQAAARRARRALTAEPTVVSVRTLSPGSRQRPALLAVTPRAGSNAAAEFVPDLRRVADAAASPVEASIGGLPAYYADVTEYTRDDLARAERVGLPLTLAVLLLAFGSLAAASLCLGVGVGGLAGAFAALLGLTYLLDVQVFVLNLAALVGLGVGVDYALLTTSRIRFELGRGASPLEAIETAGANAGHAVVISGAAVLLSLSGLFAIGMSSFNGMAIGTMLTVATMVLAALTLVPALASLLGHKLAPKRPTDEGNRLTPAARLARTCTSHPVASALAATAVLLVLALPALGVRFEMPGSRILPESSETRVSADLAARALGEGADAPVIATVEDPRSRESLALAETMTSHARALPAVAGVQTFATDPSLTSRDVGLVQARLTEPPESDAARRVVEELRALGGDRVEVGGQPAQRVDEVDRYGDRLPLALGGVLIATALILLLTFRSVAIPVKAVLATLLSVAAASGAVVWVFQEGNLTALLGFQEIGAVPAFLPIFLFPIIFGLSMDYEIFLLSRIAEERRRGLSDRDAIREGVAQTARTITGAAAVMVSVALAFAGTSLVFTQATGFGIVVAVVLDATLVRLALVPAVLSMLGPRAWWFPHRTRNTPALAEDAG